MYHRVWPALRDGLTVTPEQLREQWTCLRDEGYECLGLTRFLAIVNGLEPAPRKAFLITFDDGYRNNLEHVLPLLHEFGWEATIFIVAGTLDRSYDLQAGQGPSEKLDAAGLMRLAGPHIQLGLHGYHHENFSQYTFNGLRSAISAACGAFDNAGIPYQKVLAYPYGARPKDAEIIHRLKSWMRDFGIEAAFRIGNKPQAAPATDLYELKRIDIRGEESLADFRIKLRKGKLKPF